MTDSDSDRKALESLIVENQELEKLEALLGQFNIFEAVGAVHVEVRHSDFLSFLLDPSQNHGLGDIFTKRLLQRALADGSDLALPVNPIDLDLWDLDDLVAFREWQNIDILLVDEQIKLVVITIPSPIMLKRKVPKSGESCPNRRFAQKYQPK